MLFESIANWCYISMGLVQLCDLVPESPTPPIDVI